MLHAVSHIDMAAAGARSNQVVKKGVSKKDGKAYAIKHIDKTAINDEDMDMLESECRVLKSIKHPNVVRLFEIYNTPTELILVMELVTGGELFEKLAAADKHSEVCCRPRPWALPSPAP